MHYLRSVRNEKTFQRDDFDPIKAAQWIAESVGDTSLYRVDCLATAERVATVLAMYVKLKPESFACVLIPSELIDVPGRNVVPCDSEVSHGLLHQTHCNVDGLEPDDVRLSLCEALRDHPASHFFRLRFDLKSDAKAQALARAEIADVQWGAAALAIIAGKPKWLAYIHEAGLPPVAPR